jgi:hypothetical protein
MAELSPAPGAERPSLLVLEDDAALSYSMVRYLTSQGYAVHSADSSDRAMQLLDESERLDLLIADFWVPGTLDGVELVHALRNRKWPISWPLRPFVNPARLSRRAIGCASAPSSSTAVSSIGCASSGPGRKSVLRGPEGPRSLRTVGRYCGPPNCSDYETPESTQPRPRLFCKATKYSLSCATALS